VDINKILTALRRERAQIEEVIINLELLALSREHRRGRPPAILVAARKRGRPRGSKNKTALVRAKEALAAVSHTRTLAVGQTAMPQEIAG
jgi:hypothetical protein